MHANHVLEWRAEADTRGRIDSQTELLPEQIPWSVASPRRRLKWHAARACWAPGTQACKSLSGLKEKGIWNWEWARQDFALFKAAQGTIPAKSKQAHSKTDSALLLTGNAVCFASSSGKNNRYFMVCLLQWLPIFFYVWTLQCFDITALERTELHNTRIWWKPMPKLQAQFQINHSLSRIIVFSSLNWKMTMQGYKQAVGLHGKEHCHGTFHPLVFQEPSLSFQMLVHIHVQSLNSSDWKRGRKER